MESAIRSAMAVMVMLAGFIGTAPAALAQRAPAEPEPMRVGVAGNEPFVVETGGTLEGIAVEVWQSAAAQSGWRFEFRPYETVAGALQELADGELDAVVGPVSITSERMELVRFSQPFFSSSLAILSRTEPPTLWQRLSPFFSESFFYALWAFLSVLAVVGTIMWLAERRHDDSHFPQTAVKGIGSGIWFAIVTMSTVGYGDMAPKTVLGRVVTGVWIVVSLVMATSLIAGIASTLTLSGIDVETIGTAAQMRGRLIAVLPDSPGQSFAQRYGGRTLGVDNLQQGFDLLNSGATDALVFDRPQLRHFMMQQEPQALGISEVQYERQNYGFALRLDDPDRLHELDVQLLRIEESGVLARITRDWLGEDPE